MANKRLNTTVVIGGAVASTLRSAVSGATGQLGKVGRTIRATEREQRELNQTIKTFSRQGRDVSHLRNEHERLTRELERQRRVQSSLIGLEKSRANVGQAWGNMVGRAGTVARDGAVAGAGAAYIFKSQFVDTAAEFEKFQTILETTEGSAQGASEAMDWVSDFAAKTPYELATVTDAFVKLRAYGMDPTSGMLRSLGDTSAAMGKDITQAVEAMADAVTGENERLKEFGIRGSKSGGTITYEYTNKAGETVTKEVDAENREMIQSTLTAIFNEKYAGQMDKLSGTWSGMISNLGDQWTRWTNMVMEKGVFSMMKDELSGFLDTVNEMAEDGRLEEYAERVASGMIAFGRGVYQVGQALASVTSTLARFVGGWDNLVMVMAGLRLAPLILSVIQFGGALWGMTAAASASAAAMAASGGATGVLAGGLAVVSGAVRAVGAAVMANPIGLIIGGIALAAGLLITYWEPISGFFGGLWDRVRGYFAGAWDWITTILSWSPVGLVARAWSPLVSLLGAVIRAPASILSGAWDLMRSVLSWDPLETISSAWGGVSGWFSSLWDGLLEGAAAAFGWIAGKFEWLGNAWGKAKGFLGFGGEDEEGEQRPESKGWFGFGGEDEENRQRPQVGRAMAESRRDAEPPAGANLDQLASQAQVARVSSSQDARQFSEKTEIHIHQRDGEDSEALAQRVMRLIEQRKAQQNRGALYDAAPAY